MTPITFELSVHNAQLNERPNFAIETFSVALREQNQL
jgi:hypothetical protein